MPRPPENTRGSLSGLTNTGNNLLRREKETAENLKPRDDPMKRLTALASTVMTLVCAGGAMAALVLPAQVVSSGGRSIANSTQQLNGSIGQGAAGPVSGLSFAMEIGFWQNYVAGVSAAPEVPASIWSLHQNHPNPFNPATTISFSLPSASRVRLDVYSLRGQRIRSLIDESRGAGSHKALWDGRDTHGRRVASGTYFARLVTDEGTLTKKMMLIK